MFAERLLVIFMVILEASQGCRSEAEIHTRTGSNPQLTLIRARYYYFYIIFSGGLGDSYIIAALLRPQVPSQSKNVRLFSLNVILGVLVHSYTACLPVHHPIYVRACH